MDKTTKLILGLIAVSLIGINIQMWDGKLVKDAKANTGVTKIAICDTSGDCSGIYRIGQRGRGLAVKNYGN